MKSPHEKKPHDTSVSSCPPVYVNFRQKLPKLLKCVGCLNERQQLPLRRWEMEAWLSRLMSCGRGIILQLQSNRWMEYSAGTHKERERETHRQRPNQRQRRGGKEKDSLVYTDRYGKTIVEHLHKRRGLPANYIPFRHPNWKGVTAALHMLSSLNVVLTPHEFHST